MTTPRSTVDAGSARAPAGAGSSERRQTKDGAQDAQLSDEKLFADPYAVLSEIAADTGVMQNVSAKGEGGAQAAGPATGASGGESYRDPFAPDFWSQQVAAPGAEALSSRLDDPDAPAAALDAPRTPLEPSCVAA